MTPETYTAGAIIAMLLSALGWQVNTNKELKKENQARVDKVEAEAVKREEIKQKQIDYLQSQFVEITDKMIEIALVLKESAARVPTGRRQ